MADDATEGSISDGPSANAPIERITCDGEVYAIIVRSSLPRRGHNFVTENEDTLQVGVNHYEPGSVIRPHVHLPLQRTVQAAVEVLIIESGSCRLTLFDAQNLPFRDTVLSSGDTVLLRRGGHGLEVLERCRIIEVKQGPYFGPSSDKAFID